MTQEHDKRDGAIFDEIRKRGYATGVPVRDPSSTNKFGEWEHVKSKGRYFIDGFCNIEADLTPSVIYRRRSDNTVWVRPCEEFFDGRFVRVG